MQLPLPPRNHVDEIRDAVLQQDPIVPGDAGCPGCHEARNCERNQPSMPAGVFSRRTHTEGYGHMCGNYNHSEMKESRTKNTHANINMHRRSKVQSKHVKCVEFILQIQSSRSRSRSWMHVHSKKKAERKPMPIGKRENEKRASASVCICTFSLPAACTCTGLIQGCG